MIKEAARVPILQWGRDHWSMLGYVAVAFDGTLSRERMRCNPSRHPLMAHRGSWDDKYSSRLNLGEVIGHDDWDCLDDLEAEGLLAVESMINCRVRMTHKGSQVAFQLRDHKAAGGSLSTFQYTPIEAST